MKFAISHTTSYTYQGAVRESFNEARLRPVQDAKQTLHAFTLEVSEEAALRNYIDFYGNSVDSFEIASPHESLSVSALSTVETTKVQQERVAQVSQLAPLAVSSLKKVPAVQNFYDFVMASPYAPASNVLWRFAMDCFAETDGYWNFLNDLNRRVFEHFEYVPGSTEVDTLADVAFEQEKGVCQDYAHVFIAAARSLSLPVRYTSGYFHVPEHERQSVEGISSVSSHAWIEAYYPEVGWIGFDPTHNRVTDDRYITIARGRDYGDARPISGTYRGAPVESLDVSVNVEVVG